MRLNPHLILHVCAFGLATLAAIVTLAPAASLARAAAASRTASSSPFRYMCGASHDPGIAHCYAILRQENVAHLDSGGSGGPPPPPSGYTPADLQSAYALPTMIGGHGQTIALIDAFDDPVAEADLAVYRSTFGLPPCDSSNGCFHKVDQRGGTHYPRVNEMWATEISLDLDVASAICPQCHLLLVEADSDRMESLGSAVNEAAKLGATEISNSYGGPEMVQERAFDRLYFNHPGIVITASSGDSGYGPQYPAASPSVVAVGGTSLVPDGTAARGWSETAWSGSGSGCSAYEPQAAWQTAHPALAAACDKRAIADISAVADPSTGVRVYDSFLSNGLGGWHSFGGTSVGASLIAGVYALAGARSSILPYALPYVHAARLHDIMQGTNGDCGTLLCSAQAGWDGLSGNGTPNGIAGFE